MHARAEPRGRSGALRADARGGGATSADRIRRARKVQRRMPGGARRLLAGNGGDGFAIRRADAAQVSGLCSGRDPHFGAGDRREHRDFHFARSDSFALAAGEGSAAARAAGSGRPPVRQQLRRQCAFLPDVPRFSGSQRSVLRHVCSPQHFCEPLFWRRSRTRARRTGFRHLLQRSGCAAGVRPHHPARRRPRCP